MAIIPANMDNCGPKRKCLWGDNEGIAYTDGEACPPNETFSEELCDCEGYFFCDCSCHDDCGDCELCVGGECVDDPSCSTGVWVFRGTQMTGGGTIIDVVAGVTQEALNDGWRVFVSGAAVDTALLFAPTGSQECSPGGGCNGIDVKPLGPDVCSGAVFGCDMYRVRSPEVGEGPEERESMILDASCACPVYGGQPIPFEDQGCYLQGEWTYEP